MPPTTDHGSRIHVLGVARRSNERSDDDHDDEGVDTDYARPQKRPKTRACLRCRRRKQRCDAQRPCTNCSKAGEHCSERTTTSSPHAVSQPQAQPQSQSRPYHHDSLSWPPHHSPAEPLVTSTSGACAIEQGPVHNTDPPTLALTSLASLAALEARVALIEQATLQSAGSRTSAATVSPNAAGLLETPLPLHTEPPPPTGSFGSVSYGPVPLARSTPAAALLGAFTATGIESTGAGAAVGADVLGAVDDETEAALFRTYEMKVQWRYPFLRLHELRQRGRGPAAAISTSTAFFITMIYAVALLLYKPGSGPVTAGGLGHEGLYRVAVTQLLAGVFNTEDRVLHVQAYLMLAMHAVYSPSTQRIITLASAAMRYCVLAQLHCAAAEPAPVDVATRVRIQLRRRVFWCAYKLDRTVGAIYHLPFAVPDAQITVRLYANVDDADLEQRCRDAAGAGAAGGETPGVARLTDMSAALHVVYCRQIQSEILNFTLHRDYADVYARSDRWRLRVLDKLDRWRALWDRYYVGTDAGGGGHDWIAMMYSYSLGMLYQPTRAPLNTTTNTTTITTTAADWTVKASVQACLIFRRFQRDTDISELWLGLVTQFKCGVALLYTLFATPPARRTPVFHHPDVPDAIRACSITLNLIAERWNESRCLRDAFDLLAREVPVVEHIVASARPRRVRDDSRRRLLTLLERIEPIVVHRDTLRMIREMATDDFPCCSTNDDGRCGDDVSASPTTIHQQQQQQHHQPEYAPPSGPSDMPESFFQPLSPSGLYLDAGLGLGDDAMTAVSIEYPVIFDSFDLTDTFAME